MEESIYLAPMLMQLSKGHGQLPSTRATAKAAAYRPAKGGTNPPKSLPSGPDQPQHGFRQQARHVQSLWYNAASGNIWIFDQLMGISPMIYQASLNRSRKKNEITLHILSDLNGVKLDINNNRNNRKHRSSKALYSLKKCLKIEKKKQVKVLQELNENERTEYPYL